MFSLKNRYLNILGLNEGASEKDIKKAYRRKALLYHPDRNDSLSAQTEFIRINEAYEYLTNPALQIYPQTKNDVENDIEERIKRAKQNFKKRQEAQKREQIRLNNQFRSSFLYQTFIPVYIFNIILLSILAFDNYSKPKEITAYVESITNNGFLQQYKFNTERGSYSATIDIEYSSFSSDLKKPFTLYFSPILNDLKSVKQFYTAGNQKSIYYYFNLIFLLMLIPTISLFIKNYAVQAYLMLCISYSIPIFSAIFILLKL